MNKYIFISSALLLLSTACVKEEEMDSSHTEPMKFDSFVEQGTKAVGSKLEDINSTMGVWGYKFKKGTSPTSSQYFPIFQSQTMSQSQIVSFENNSWVYTPQRYWDSTCDYHFYAISPHSLDATCYFNEGKLWINEFRVNSNIEDQVDVLIAARKDITSPQAVEFVFTHVLARVNFKLQSGIPAYGSDADGNPLYETIEVTRITLRDVFCQGICGFTLTENKVNVHEWGYKQTDGILYDSYTKSFTPAVNLSYKGETKDGMMNLFLIPWPTSDVRLDIEYKVGDVEFSKSDILLPESINSWKPNVNYTYTLVLNPYGAPISFGPIETGSWATEY
ncbi:MAG: fimbrillin family protein [Bacteroidales bacterium]